MSSSGSWTWAPRAAAPWTRRSPPAPSNSGCGSGGGDGCGVDRIRPMIRRIETAAAVLLTMLAAALHVMRALHAGPLWRDEAGALQVALLPTFGEMFQRFPH